MSLNGHPRDSLYQGIFSGRDSHWGGDHERKWNNLNLVAAANLYPATSPPLMHGEPLRDGEATTCVMSVEPGGGADVNPSVVRGRPTHAWVRYPAF